MSYYPIKLRPADRLFSDYIREKAKWRCEYCGRLCKIGNEWIYKLEASHYISRGKETTRFDPQNVYALCFTCHKDLGGYTRDENGEYDLWVKKKLGERDYRYLVLRANQVGKRDDFMAMLVIRALIKNLKETNDPTRTITN